MASSVGAMKSISRLSKPVLMPLAAALISYGAYNHHLVAGRYLAHFFTGPGRKSRILALLFLLLNWKSLPFAWTFRIFHAMITHILVRKPHNHGPDKLFHPVITSTHVALLEVDYNMHKSNSTYFADLDISRSHLASHLLAKGFHDLAHNAQTRLVTDPARPDRPAKGPLGVMLGAVHCSFKKELKPFQRYEMWTRVLSWDRKWLYMVTHFVQRGAVKPRSWDAESYGLTRRPGEQAEEWEGKIHATAVSKYVFKIGRLTVHPAIMLGASGLLPDRPDGWLSAQSSGAVTPAESMVRGDDKVAAATDHHGLERGWGWRRVEEERRLGLEFADHFAALDGLAGRFDRGDDGALGHFRLG